MNTEIHFREAGTVNWMGVKIKLSLCLTKHHAMKTYWRSGCIAPRILDIGSRWRWVVSFTPRPLYPQGKSPWYPLDGRLGALKIWRTFCVSGVDSSGSCGREVLGSFDPPNECLTFLRKCSRKLRVAMLFIIIASEGKMTDDDYGTRNASHITQLLYILNFSGVLWCNNMLWRMSGPAYELLRSDSSRCQDIQDFTQ
jgi:hypothetical protein